ncbi:uncharacterized protein LOC131183036 [Hevea brasiliensis]|uniref:uncharacterized protein LOC131183036 n=1 Tax=Hevea brasiliensis TaxID=3981 RepID=UPI0025CD80E6|nr:uncharacterized protein LOC131183036 [Hevea brasiliensis]
MLKQLHYTPEQQLECALSSLQEKAYQWWDIVSRAVQLTALTEDFFLTEFKKKYISHIYLEARRREFLTLKQRQLTVSEYEREFVRLGRYAPEIMPKEADRCLRFEDGLHDNIRLIVMAHEYTDFSKLVDAALNVERVRNDEQTRRDRHRKRSFGQGQSSTPVSEGKRPKGSPSQGQIQRSQFTQRGGQSRASVGSSPGTAVEGLTSIPLCTYCERRHRGECRLLTEGCFQCRATDYFLRDCPHRSVPTAPLPTERSTPAAQRGRRLARPEAMGTSQRPASGTIERPEVRVAPRIYAMRAQEGPESAHVVRGTFLIIIL